MIARSALAESSEKVLSIGIEGTTAPGAEGRRHFPTWLFDDVIIDSAVVVGCEVLALFLYGIPCAE